MPQTAPVLEDVLVDIVVGGGADPVAEAVGLQLGVGLVRRPVLVLHAVDGGHDAGAVQAGLAVDQHRIGVVLVHQVEELVHGRRPLRRHAAARDQVGLDEDVADAQPPAQLAFLDRAPVPEAAADVGVGEVVLQIDDGADLETGHGVGDAVGGHFAGAVEAARLDLAQPFVEGVDVAVFDDRPDDTSRATTAERARVRTRGMTLAPPCRRRRPAGPWF